MSLVAGALIVLSLQAAPAQSPGPSPTPTTFNVSTAEELAAAINAAYWNSQASLSTVTTINLTSDMVGSEQMIVNANVVINGGGNELNMNHTDRAFFIAGGNVTINNLTISEGVARGGNGAGGGGGGAGLGGAIFVGSGTYEAYDKTSAALGVSTPVVTLNGVSFWGNVALGGGTTTSPDVMSGGGGGMGGDSGDGASWANGGGGGGGFGVSANGGDGAPYNKNAGSGNDGAFINITGTSTSGGAGGNGDSSDGGAGGANGGGGGGGGGGTPEGTGGGGGLGGERGFYANNVTPNNGGYGGFGGGGGGNISYVAGDGGFGGGGGAGATGGNGGFGGGGGSATYAAGNGGFGAGNGTSTTGIAPGGGGLGAGGAVFVMKGGSLIVTDATFSSNEALAGSGSTNGSAIGDDLFLGEDVVFNVSSSISVGSIGGAGNMQDQNVSAHATDANAQGGVIKQGAGTMTLTGTSYYSGQTVINSGVLALGPGAQEIGTSGTVVGQNNGDNATLLLGSGSTYAHASPTTALQIAENAGSTGQVVIGSGGQSNGAYVDVQGFNGGAGTASVSFQQMYGPTGEAQYEFYVTLTGTLQVIQAGPGTTVLNPQYGANTYSGGTLVQQGTLQAAGTNSLGTGAVTVSGSSTLALATGANVTVTGPLTVSDSSTLAVAAGATLSTTGAVAVNDSAVLALDNNANLTNTGLVTVTDNGAVTLAKGAQATGITGMVVGVNSGDNAVLQLLSDNTYVQVEHSSIMLAQNAGSTGQMIIGSGEMSKGSSIFVHSIEGGAGNATLSFQHAQQSYEMYTLLEGSLKVVQNGPGTTVLRNAANSYTGGTFVQSGTLVMEIRGVLGNGPVLVTGGTFSDPNGLVTHPVNLAGGQYTVGLVKGETYSGLGKATSAFNDGRATGAALLDGTVGEGSTLVTSFTTSSTAGNDWQRISDVYNFTGTGSDIIVMQLSLANIGDDAFLAWLDPNANEWVNAVNGNRGNDPPPGSQGYMGSFDQFAGEYYYYTLNQYVGAWGVDVSVDSGLGTVWAVLDNADNSQFAVAPEPSTWALLFVAGGVSVVMIWRRRTAPRRVA